ncbi:MAG: hypothetical protein RIB45_13700 [Marivibrio sp.]|uniref:hypothetical protein n=1 Tax=Marivibrio sp. TaxID=2039719 RepID=UPI0032F02BF4
MGEKKRRKAAGADSGVQTPSGRGRKSRAPRITGRTIAWFLGGCLMLDVILWAVFHFGLARCYGVLCLL